MSEQSAVKSILGALARLRDELASYTKEAENKIAGLEIAYEALTGEKPPKSEEGQTRRQPRQTGRRGMRIDRKSGEKTYNFLKERGDKLTTVAMVARKFNISPEAASQRLLNLHKAGSVARMEKGKYIDASRISKSEAGAS